MLKLNREEMDLLRLKCGVIPMLWLLGPISGSVLLTAADPYISASTFCGSTHSGRLLTSFIFLDPALWGPRATLGPTLLLFSNSSHHIEKHTCFCST